MKKRKIARRGPMMRQEPETKRRWLILNEATGQPTLGCWNANCDGITSKEKAHKRASSLVISTDVVLAHEFFGRPDPDESEE